MPRSLALLVLLACASAPIAAAAACNSSDGVVSEDASQLPTPATDQSAPPDLVDGPGRLAEQTLIIDLTRDLDTLSGLRGRYTADTPVLGVRLENRPGFNPAKGCNALIPILYKPRIETLPDGTLLASVENKRFQLAFNPRTETATWARDRDASGQFFWIFPARFGYDQRKKRYGPLTTAYDARYQRLGSSDVNRRWVAEAYLLAVLRIYRRDDLNKGFPLRPLPTGADLQQALATRLGYSCDTRPTELVCVANRLIEKNETAPPNPEIAEDAFRISDAVFGNSGISTGIRQLDFGTGNEQAAALVKDLMPTTVGRDPLYRRPIRKWNIATANRWYDVDGPVANQELSRAEAKALLVRSHAEYIVQESAAWQARIQKAYPDWLSGEQMTLAVFAIDLRNVTGRSLARPPGAASACEVLTATDPLSKEATSGNLALVLSQQRRMRNGLDLIQAMSPPPADLSCLVGPLTPKS